MTATENMDQAVLVIVEITSIHDQEGFKKYQLGAREQIGRRGGAVVARGGASLEGAPAFGSLMIQRWSSEQKFLDWQSSEEYQPLRSIRLACADTRIAVVPLLA